MFSKTWFPAHDLYDEYKKNYIDLTFSKRIPDVTKKITLEGINIAINCCEKWDNFLDIGASTGHYSSALVNKFKNGLLVEATPPPELAMLTKKFSNLSYQSIYIEDLKTDIFFDFIMLIDVFEHIEKIEPFAEQISRLQTKGGVVYILTPNPLYCGPAIESEIYHTKHKDGHYKHYISIEVTEIMSKNGYSLIRESYEERPLRDKARIVLKAMARRDALLQKNLAYRFFISLFSYPLKLFISMLEYFIYRNEIRDAGNELNTRITTLIYKKI